MQFIPAYVIICIIISGILIPTNSVFSTYAFADELKIPDWLKNNARWWADGQIDNATFLKAIEFLIINKIIASDSIKVIESNQDIISKITIDDKNFFSTAKSAITGWIGEIQKDPTANLIVKSTLPIIPVVGPLLSNLYDNVEGTPTEKNQKILELLKEYQNMNEEGLKKSFSKLDENKEAIKNNTYKLEQVLVDTKQILVITTDTNDRVKNLETKLDQALTLLSNIQLGKNTKISSEFKNQLNEITQLDSQINDNTLSIAQLESLSKAYVLQEEYEPAIKIYEQILQQDSKNYNALIEKSWSLYGLEKFSEAQEAFDKLLIIYPQDSEGWVGKGWSLFDGELIDEAEKAFEKSLEIDNTNADAIAGLGWVYLYNEDCNMAKITLSKALEIDKENIDASFGLESMNFYGCYN